MSYEVSTDITRVGEPVKREFEAFQKETVDQSFIP
jgi:hypothetical protein